MDNQTTDMKWNVIYGLNEVIAMINRNPHFTDDEEFWGVIERLYRAIVLLDQLSEPEIRAHLNSPSTLSFYNEYMCEWSESISPVDGWPNRLTSRLPVRSLVNGCAEIDLDL